MIEFVRTAVLVLLCLTIERFWSADAGNWTCPVKCTCESGTLSCAGITELPVLENPNIFSSFMFYNCHFVTLKRLPLTYSNATDIVIDSSQLSQIEEDAFTNVAGLRVLDLSGNRLTNISKMSLLPLKNLTKLGLSFNRLTKLPDGIFQDLPNLRETDLGGNYEIDFTEKLFIGADDVTKLKCNGCQLKKIPSNSLKHLKSLRLLELNKNPFRSLDDDSFSGLDDLGKELNELTLDNCNLSSVSKDALRPFRNLRFLNLGHNQLKSLAVGTFNYSWNELRNLYLENNLLTSMDEKAAPWSNLQEVKLSQNPWNCDCSMAWMKDIKVVDKESVTCYTPPTFRGKSFEEAATLMSCSPHNYYFLVLVFGIPALVICGIVLVCCMVRYFGRRPCSCQRKESVTYNQIYSDTVSNGSKRSLVA